MGELIRTTPTRYKGMRQNMRRSYPHTFKSMRKKMFHDTRVRRSITPHYTDDLELKLKGGHTFPTMLHGELTE